MKFNNPNRCIYCNTQENLTKSDIIPDCITKAKLTNFNVCKKHNNLTNKLYENKFSNEFAFFRNQLGFLTRKFGEDVSYKTQIIINGEKLDKEIKIKNYRDFTRKHIIYDGKNYRLTNFNPKFCKLKNPSIQFFYIPDFSKLFLSNISLNTILKICYEFHCFNNKINYFDTRYNNIVDCILNKGDASKYVELIQDAIFDEVNLPAFGYVQGSHGLLEYRCQNKRFVVFGLFGVAWYKVCICEDFYSEFDNEIMHLYLLDEEIKEKKSSSIACMGDLNKSEDLKLVNNIFFKPSSINIKCINKKDFQKICLYKFGELINGVIITVRQIKNYADYLESLKYWGWSEKYFKEIFSYKEKDKIFAIYIFLIIEKAGKNIFKSTECLLNYVSTILKEKLNTCLVPIQLDTIKSNLKKGINIFKENFQKLC